MLVPVSGNSARTTEPTMSHDFTSPHPSVLFVQDVAGTYRPAQADEVLQTAQRLLLSRARNTEIFSSPHAVRDFLKVRLAGLEHEMFAVVRPSRHGRNKCVASSR